MDYVDEDERQEPELELEEPELEEPELELEEPGLEEVQGREPEPGRAESELLGAEVEVVPDASESPESPTDVLVGPLSPFPGRELVEGVEGEDVTLFQRAVNAWRPETLKVDGVYGPVSEDACRDLQRHAGARVDGVVGPVTWRVLRRIVR